MPDENERCLFLHVRPSTGKNPAIMGQSVGGLLESHNIRATLPSADLQFLPNHLEGSANTNSGFKIPLEGPHPMRSCLIPLVKRIIPIHKSSTAIYYETSAHYCFYYIDLFPSIIVSLKLYFPQEEICFMLRSNAHKYVCTCVCV